MREALGDLAGGLVREGEGTEPLGAQTDLLDEEADALDEAIGLPGTGPGEDEQRRDASLDRLTLLRRGQVQGCFEQARIRLANRCTGDCHRAVRFIGSSCTLHRTRRS